MQKEHIAFYSFFELISSICNTYSMTATAANRNPCSTPPPTADLLMPERGWSDHTSDIFTTMSQMNG